MVTESIGRLPDVKAPANPFPGLRRFELHESHLFFGRDGQSERLIAKLAATRFLAVVGTSGSGKSSLVRAGLLPALLGGIMTSAGSNWRLAAMSPSNDPIGYLAKALNTRDVFGSEDPENAGIQVEITQETLRTGSRGLIDAVKQAGMPARENLLVVVDQFEELFRFARESKSERFENEAAAFVKLLLEAHRQRDLNIYVVLTMRSDFLGDCAQFWELPEAINESQYLIPRLSRDQLRDAITGPVAVAAGEITPRLVNRLLNDIGDDQDQLPALQHLLMRVWDESREHQLSVDGRPHSEVHKGNAMDLCCYEAVGGMAEALSRHADEAFDGLPDVRHREIAEKMFKCLTEKGEDNREIRRQVTLAKICAVTEASDGQVKTVIDAFRQPGRSFLMPPADTPLDSGLLIDISHESLIRGWGKLKDWVKEEAESARVYSHLAEQASLHREGSAGLWGDPELQFALNWQRKNKPNADWAERYNDNFETAIDFLEKSQAERQKKIFRRRLLIAALVGLSLIATVAAFLAFRAYRQAEIEKANAKQQEWKANLSANEASKQRAIALIEKGNAEMAAQTAKEQKKLAEAQTIIAQNQTLIAITNERKANESEKQSNQILYVANMNLSQRAFEEKDYTLSLKILNNYLPSPDRLLQNDPRQFDWHYLWRLHHQEKETIKWHWVAVNSMALSLDWKKLALAGIDGRVRLLDMSTSREIATFIGPDDPTLPQYWGVQSAAFSPDGKLLAGANGDGSVKVWDLESKRELATLRKKDAYRATKNGRIAFSPNGQILAYEDSVTYGEPPVNLWEVKKSGEITPLNISGVPNELIVFPPNERIMKYGSIGKLLDAKSGELIWNLDSVRPRLLTFSPDGQYLAGVINYSTIKLWEKGQKEPTSLETSDGKAGIKVINSLVFSPDGQMLAAAFADNTVMIWMTKSRTKSATLRGHESPVNSVAFSNDGNLLASASNDGNVKFWELSAIQKQDRLDGKGVSYNSFVFSPDGSSLALLDFSGAVKLWDLKNQENLTTITGKGNIESVTFLEGGLIGAVKPIFGQLELWDLKKQRVMTSFGDSFGYPDKVEFSPDGRLMACGNSKDVKIWDIKSKQQIQEFKGSGYALTSLVFSPDGKSLIASSGAQDLRLYDLQNKREMIRNDVGTVNAVSIYKTNVVIGQGKIIELWEKNDRTLRKVSEFAGHVGLVHSVALSPDGRTLASGSEDKTVRLWDVKTGQQLARLEGHNHPASLVKFSPDGRTLASLDYYGTVKLWRGATDEDVRRQRNK